jgi:hypothetical protein
MTPLAIWLPRWALSCVKAIVSTVILLVSISIFGVTAPASLNSVSRDIKAVCAVSYKSGDQNLDAQFAVRYDKCNLRLDDDRPKVAVMGADY